MAEGEVTGTVGNYKVTYDPIIGKGVFATVHRAINKKSKEKVAAKQLFLSNDFMRQMAEGELTTLSKLQNHDNIVRIYEHIKKGNSLWIFMELCDLNDLEAYLKQNRDLSLIERVVIMKQCTRGIAFMHRQNPPIIHRDIKLQNILMKNQDGKPVVKITDFGFAKFLTERDSLATAMGHGPEMSSLRGSHYFMAPEFSAELEGGLKYDSSVDTFALGLVLLVIFENKEGYDLIPLSVEKKLSKTMCSIGFEMVSCFKEKRPLPAVVCVSQSDNPTVRRIKRIIKHMTQFKRSQRKNIQEVEEEILELADEMASVVDVDESIGANSGPKQEQEICNKGDQWKVTYEQQQQNEMQCPSTKHCDNMHEQTSISEKQKKSRQNTDRSLREVKDPIHEIATRLASKMNTKPTEAALGNVSKCQPMEVVETYSQFVATTWLDAKHVLNQSNLPDTESSSFLCELLFVANDCAIELFEKTKQAFTGDFIQIMTDPFLTGKEPSEDKKGKGKATNKLGIPTEVLTVHSDQLCREADKVDINALQEKIKEKIMITHSEIKKYVNAVPKYIRKSTFVSCKMAIQRPPMRFACPDIGKPYRGQKHHPLALGSNPNAKGATVKFYQYPSLLHGEVVMVKGKVFVS